jgi:signal transduction histidine kinase
MTHPGNGQEQARWAAEVLRRASAVLHGRMVGVWEVSPENSLVPVITNVTEALAWDATPEVKEALRHMAMPAGPGSRWVAGRVSGAEHWCVAPVRDRVPAPPPYSQERRSRERLALELAGLCLGLSSHGAQEPGSPAAAPDLFQRFTEQLGAFAQEIGTPLAAARQAVARSGAVLSGTAQPELASRDKLVADLRVAARALEQAVALVKTVQERARAVVASSGSFDLVQVAWACVDTERAQAALRGAAVELKTLAYAVTIPGNADDLRSVLAAAIHAAVDNLQGRVGTVRVSVENIGPIVMLAVRAPGPEGLEAYVAAIATAKRTVEQTFGGTLTVTAQPGEGITCAISIPVPSHRFRDPALWWER